MLKVEDNKIYITRGDTARFKIELLDENGELYIPKETDHIYFRLKQYTDKPGVLLEKEIDVTTLNLAIEEEDTINLSAGSYYYEVEVVSDDNYHFTAITKTLFKITAEIEDHA